MDRELLRALPSVDEIAVALQGRFPHKLIVDEARRILGECREQIRKAEPVGDPVARVAGALESLRGPSLRRVINATGVVLHTNLGRAPVTTIEPIAGYKNLEYDLESGKRGKRDVHVANLLKRLLGCEAIVVNNNAAATYLVLNELALNHEVVVSRGELIEIGDGFRIPDILLRSGATLREVGTTNRTQIQDYAAAIGERTKLLMRVHPSNFHVSGFTAKPSLQELADLTRARAVLLYEDLGSGCLVDLRPFGISEPLVADSLAAGVNVLSFSGDKLLGGPQAGIIAGDAELIARIRRNPMFRALRAGKIIYQMLEVTLRHLLFEEWDKIPVLAMIRASSAELRARAEGFAAKVDGARVIAGESVAGGGSTPDQTLPAWLIELPGNAIALERRLRSGDPPVIARIEKDRVVLDLRTVFEGEEETLFRALGC
jgi:L-seryl-tRNA(Ser) seleniumtransferase